MQKSAVFLGIPGVLREAGFFEFICIRVMTPNEADTVGVFRDSCVSLAVQTSMFSRPWSLCQIQFSIELPLVIDLVWSIALRLSGDRSEAEDGTQEVFIDLWKHAHRYDQSMGSEGAFVVTIARRRLIDRLRKRNRRPNLSPERTDVAAEQPAVETQAEVREESDRVRASMKLLREAEREVLELAILQGLPQQEIAAKLDMPLGTVKSHARRGMKRLREIHQDSVTGATS